MTIHNYDVLSSTLNLDMDGPENQQLTNRLTGSLHESEEPSFPFFKKLPPELRLEVWAHNLPGPRVVVVHYDPRIGKFWTTNSAPANLLVCSESRYEMMKKWPLCFGTLGHPPIIRANLNIDTILMCWVPLRLGAVSQEDLSTIVSLEIGGIGIQPAHPDAVLQLILTMTNLRDFSIVSPALRDIFSYELNKQLSRLRVATNEEEHWLLAAQRLCYEERRNRAFRQHTELTRAFRFWARKHPDCKLPRLRLLISEPDGSRSGPFFWKP